MRLRVSLDINVDPIKSISDESLKVLIIIIIERESLVRSAVVVLLVR